MGLCSLMLFTLGCQTYIANTDTDPPTPNQSLWSIQKGASEEAEALEGQHYLSKLARDTYHKENRGPGRDTYLIYSFFTNGQLLVHHISNQELSSFLDNRQTDTDFEIELTVMDVSASAGRYAVSGNILTLEVFLSAFEGWVSYGGFGYFFVQETATLQGDEFVISHLKERHASEYYNREAAIARRAVRVKLKNPIRIKGKW